MKGDFSMTPSEYDTIRSTVPEATIKASPSTVGGLPVCVSRLGSQLVVGDW
jgi:hypothetical protein